MQLPGRTSKEGVIQTEHDGVSKVNLGVLRGAVNPSTVEDTPLASISKNANTDIEQGIQTWEQVQ